MARQPGNPYGVVVLVGAALILAFGGLLWATTPKAPSAHRTATSGPAPSPMPPAATSGQLPQPASADAPNGAPPPTYQPPISAPVYRPQGDGSEAKYVDWVRRVEGERQRLRQGPQGISSGQALPDILLGGGTAEQLTPAPEDADNQRRAAAIQGWAGDLRAARDAIAKSRIPAPPDWRVFDQTYPQAVRDDLGAAASMLEGADNPSPSVAEIRAAIHQAAAELKRIYAQRSEIPPLQINTEPLSSRLGGS